MDMENARYVAELVEAKVRAEHRSELLLMALHDLREGLVEALSPGGPLQYTSFRDNDLFKELLDDVEIAPGQFLSDLPGWDTVEQAREDEREIARQDAATRAEQMPEPLDASVLEPADLDEAGLL